MRTAEDALRSLKKYLAEGVLPEWEVALAIEEGTFVRPFCRVGFSAPTQYAGPAVHSDAVQAFACHLFPIEQPTAEAALLEALRVEDLLYEAFRVGSARLADPAQAPVAVTTEGVGALAAGTYRYRVSALGLRGESLASPPVEATLSAAGRIVVTWTPVGGAAAYNIYRGPVGAERLISRVREASFTDAGQITTPHPSKAPAVVNTTVIGAPMRVPLYDYAGLGPMVAATERGYPDYIRLTDFSTGHRQDPEDESKVVVTCELRGTWRRRGRIPDAGRTLESVTLDGTGS